jgi:hypothetical protein
MCASTKAATRAEAFLDDAAEHGATGEHGHEGEEEHHRQHREAPDRVHQETVHAIAGILVDGRLGDHALEDAQHVVLGGNDLLDARLAPGGRPSAGQVLIQQLAEGVGAMRMHAYRLGHVQVQLPRQA